MGQQQLLLIILSAVIVGIAITVGLNMFGQGAYSANRDAVMQDLQIIGARAQEWYRKPAALGGGDRSFVDLDSVQQVGFPGATANGTYTLGTGTATEITVSGVGREVAPGTIDTVKFEVTVSLDAITNPVIPD